MFAPVCSSFCAANHGTAFRDLLNGWGNFFHPSVRCGNKMMSRTENLSNGILSLSGKIVLVHEVWKDHSLGGPSSGNGLDVPIGATFWIFHFDVPPGPVVHPGFEKNGHSSIMASHSTKDLTISKHRNKT